jgi:hypothetical protein
MISRMKWRLAAAVGLLAASPAFAAGPDPKALCEAAKGAGIGGEDLYWAAASDNPAYFFCDGGKHDFPGGEGSILMYRFQVSGDTAGASAITVTTNIYDDKVPTETINRTLQPLLDGIFAAAGLGPVPGDVARGVAAVAPFSAATPLGVVTASYQPGSHADNPYNGAEYTLRIELQSP